ncbi:MAG TPA: hypothetical protein VED59_06995, partial [Acidimicrobiales bacterium]|nr:hypothetical protein [Acidimicrobiales bacterium]
PAVYVLDCDGATVGSGAESVGGVASVRATTPNWSDPSAPKCERPSVATDRYALGLVFLRVVGAAHFPVQGPQRAGERVSIDFALPRAWRRVGDLTELWGLCERSLSLADPPGRPSPGEWAAQLESLLVALGRRDLCKGAEAAQRSVQRHTLPTRPALRVPDVEIRPVRGIRPLPTWQLFARPPSLAGPMLAGARPTNGPCSVSAGVPTKLKTRGVALHLLAAWTGIHRLVARLVWWPGRRLYGLRRLAALAALDLVLACAALFLVAMVVSPWIGL